MFDTVRNNRRIIQLVLALIMLPFAFFGMDAYFREMGNSDAPAVVGGSKIGMAEFRQALREQQERMRPALGGKADPAMLDSPELRRMVLDRIVAERLIALNAAKARLTVGNEQLVQFITTFPALQDNGKFSPQRYRQLVAAQGITEEQFEGRIRQDLVMQQESSAIATAAIPGATSAGVWVAAQLEEREVSEALIRPDMYAAGIKIDSAAVQAFYERNRQRFEQPEQVRAEYVVLSLERLMEQTSLSEEQLRAAYKAKMDRYRQPEERQASHILIAVAKDAPEAAVKAAQVKAEGLLAQLKKSPGDFARLAQQNSNDPGSAANGGDLSWFGRGMMVPPFEESAFSLKEGAISELVRTDFGFHIIKLTGIRPERVKSFESVQAEIAAELKRETAARKYAEMAEAFANMVYEQSDSLKPAQEKFRLNLQTSDWIVKNGQAAAPFTHPKLQAALFSDEVVNKKHNTEAVEVAQGTLVAARLAEHRPAVVQPLEAVAADIEKYLVREEAVKLAIKDGADKFARLQAGEALNVSWGQPRVVVRSHAPNLSPEAAKAVFRTSVSKLPAYAGVALPGGYALYRISQVRAYVPGAEETPRARSLRDQYARIAAEQEAAGWLQILRQRFPVSIHQSALEAKDR
jgi:peptidyl-prolyl cis-trans isomerase D